MSRAMSSEALRSKRDEILNMIMAAMACMTAEAILDISTTCNLITLSIHLNENN